MGRRTECIYFKIKLVNWKMVLSIFLQDIVQKNKKKRKHERKVKQHKRSIGSNLLTEVSEAVN